MSPKERDHIGMESLCQRTKDRCGHEYEHAAFGDSDKDGTHSDGPHSPSNNVTDNGSQTGRRPENSAGTLKDNNPEAEIAGHQQQSEKPTGAGEVAEERAERRQRPVKPTARPSEFYYF